MPEFNKNIRLISLVEGDVESLTEKANRIFEYVNAMKGRKSLENAIVGVSIGQTYRTYESRTVGVKAKTFHNVPFFTNSIVLAFANDYPNHAVKEIMDDIVDLISDKEEE